MTFAIGNSSYPSHLYSSLQNWDTGRFGTVLLLFLFLFYTKCFGQLTREDPLVYVDPFICTEGDNGQLYPGATYPFGLVHLSPETEGDSHVGYYYEDKYIEGFSHLRIGGAGSKGKGGGLLIKPGIGEFTSEIAGFRERYDKRSEEASPGYYKVTMESGVTAELTVTERTGFHQYTFPEQPAKGRYVVIELSHSYVGMSDASLTVRNGKEITGMIKSFHNNRGGYHKLYYAIVAETPFTGYTSWNGAEERGQVAQRHGKETGIWLNLPDSGEKTFRFKVGLSPVSEDQALYEATHEADTWDFNTIRERASSAWREKLSKAEIKGSDDELKKLFYTHLYHSYLVPNNVTASDGRYRAAYQEDSLYSTRTSVPGFTCYSVWSLWDDFRKYSLISLLEPGTSRNIVHSLVDYYAHRPPCASMGPEGCRRFHDADGYWPAPSIRTEFAGAVIMDAYNKGIRDFDTSVAFKGMKEDFDHYKDGNVSEKLEKAYHAYIAGEMVRAIGKDREADALKNEALAYRKLWCSDQKDKQGNIRGFFTPGGNPVPDVEAFENYVYEGNLWHYRWFVLHDIAGLARHRGGRDKLSEDLEYFFEKDFYMHLNEPDIQAPYVFNLLGKPYLTQKWARAITTKSITQLYHNHGYFDQPITGRIYRADPKGYIESMDDDAGAMASWFVMSAMGLFPFDPVQPYYLIGSPIFPELALHLDNGRTFRILAKDVSEDNFYIQSARLNGKPFNKCWLDYLTLQQGGTLELEMGNQPSKTWGTDMNGLPSAMD